MHESQKGPRKSQSGHEFFTYKKGHRTLTIGFVNKLNLTELFHNILVPLLSTCILGKELTETL